MVIIESSSGVRAALPILVVTAMLSGCASDYVWTRTEPPSTHHEWVVAHSKQALHNVCARSYETHPSLAACAFQIRQTGKCWVYSVWTADEAKRAYAGDRDDLYTHEMRHCEGMRHP